MIENTVIDLGEIKEQAKFELEFPYGKDVTHILSVTSPCDCAIPGINGSKKIIKISYTSKKIPPHLQEQGFYEVEKVITVTYRIKDVPEGDFEAQLTFKAKVIK